MSSQRSTRAFAKEGPQYQYRVDQQAEAASAMLAALKTTRQMCRNTNRHALLAEVETAIAAAESAGIKAEG